MIASSILHQLKVWTSQVTIIRCVVMSHETRARHDKGFRYGNVAHMHRELVHAKT